MDPNELVRIYPWLDHMLADTLIKMHEQGKLQSYMDSLPEEPPQPTSSVLTGAITVESPGEIISATE